MRPRALSPVTVHAAACTILACAFLWGGASEAGRVGTAGIGGSFHTTDRYLSTLTNDPEGSEHLAQALAKLPEDKPIAVVFREGNVDEIFLSDLVSYFSWPREVRWVGVNRSNAAAQQQMLATTDVSAIAFCGLAPLPWTETLTRVGDRLVVARAPHSVITAP